ncbi:MAG: MFS transporter [Chloroflexi bacterium]|nr:MAG: MFS transporter [Chloroflexota bacterium]RLC87074.1 MAG: MFS transporter [Chloroflexota bacterium]HEY68764.1 MFS transporter [Thermoflexia bacterium]
MAEKLKHMHRKIVNAWCMYDWANSAFATTIMAAVLPTFYSAVAGATLAPDPEKAAVLASAYWGYTNTIAMLLVALAAPILGAIADHSGARKRFLGGFAGLGILFTALMVLVGTGDWLMASAFYILGRIGFAGANIFYDALLPHIAHPDEIDQVSTKGYALGYLGGGLLLVINLAWIMKPEWFGLPNAELASRLSFFSVAIWWAVFSIPLFRRVPEPPSVQERGESANPVKAGFQRLRRTFHEIRRYRELFKFLIAFWLYNDGIGTIITMAVIFGKEIGIGTTDLIGAILAVQFIGIPFSFAFGWLARRLGAKRSIMLALGVYTIIAIGGYFMQSGLHFWILAFLVATVQGGSQALSRSLFGRMAPRAKTAEFFGFYDVSSKFAGIVGPALFGVVGQLAGSSRLSIISLIIFFIVGGGLLLWVNEREGIRVAEEENRAAGLA